MPNISSLPYELLSQILLALPRISVPISDHASDVAFLLVCRFWYKVAMSTPSLWTQIILRLKTPLTDLIRYLDLSKSEKLDVCLKSLDGAAVREIECLAECMKYLHSSQNINRIKALTIESNSLFHHDYTFQRAIRDQEHRQTSISSPATLRLTSPNRFPRRHEIWLHPRGYLRQIIGRSTVLDINGYSIHSGFWPSNSTGSNINDTAVRSIIFSDVKLGWAVFKSLGSQFPMLHHLTLRNTTVTSVHLDAMFVTGFVSSRIEAFNSLTNLTIDLDFSILFQILDVAPHLTKVVCIILDTPKFKANEKHRIYSSITSLEIQTSYSKKVTQTFLTILRKLSNSLLNIKRLEFSQLPPVTAAIAPDTKYTNVKPLLEWLNGHNVDLPSPQLKELAFEHVDVDREVLNRTMESIYARQASADSIEANLVKCRNSLAYVRVQWPCFL